MKLSTKKQKGDLAELKVACDLRRRGYLVLIPFGEAAPYDLVIDRNGNLERVQVKYRDRGERTAIEVPCYSQTIIHGKSVSRTRYTLKRSIGSPSMTSIRIGDSTYPPRSWAMVASHSPFASSRRKMASAPASGSLRITRICRRGICDSPPSEVEPAGLEPATSSVQGKRSPN